MNINKLIAIMLLLSCFLLATVSCKKDDNNDDTPTVDNSGNNENTDDNVDSGDNNTDGGSEDEDTNVTPPADKPEPITYEEYTAMTPEERQAYYFAFLNHQDFFYWYNEAKAKYDEEHKNPEIDGDIDIGDLIGGN